MPTQKILLLIALLSLVGCAVKPQEPITMQDRIWDTPEEMKIGIIMTQVPVADMYLPGANCLLCIAAAEVANAGLNSHAQTLSLQELQSFQGDIANLLSDKNIQAVVIEAPLQLEELGSNQSESSFAAKKDFTPFAEKYDITHLIVIEVRQHGFHRTYASYVPTSDPKAYIRADAYLINLSRNIYQWYAPVNTFKGVADQWSEPPNFPALTNAYYQAVEITREHIKAPFKTVENHLASIEKQ